LLLLITSSGDATADLLADHFSEPFFRLNVDIYHEYDFVFTPEFWEVQDPTGRNISSETASRCVWWKAFLNSLNDDQFIKHEVQYAINELYNWFRSRNLIIGNPPNVENELGKIRQAKIASEFFRIPDQRVGWGNFLTRGLDSSVNWVAKSLSSQLMADGKALFTTEVDPYLLDPQFIWTLQNKISADHDVTIQVAGTDIFAFSRSRKDLKSLDWRREIFTSDTEWLPYELSPELKNKIQKMMVKFGLDWGRIDLLDCNGTLYFLEINPNGQWAFLDPQNEHSMITTIAKYLEFYQTH
jgi:hypothetical protein